MSTKLTGRCGDCALWIQKKRTSPKVGTCSNTKKDEYENGGCEKFIDRAELTQTDNSSERKCGNCAFKNCKETIFFPGQATLCKDFFSKNLKTMLKKNRTKKGFQWRALDE